MLENYQASNHFHQRASQRAFRKPFIDLIDEHGDLIEQKGKSYVLILDNPQKVHDLKQEFASEEQELLYKRKKLRRQIATAKKAINVDANLVDQLETMDSSIKTELKHITQHKKAIKPD